MPWRETPHSAVFHLFGMHSREKETTRSSLEWYYSCGQHTCIAHCNAKGLSHLIIGDVSDADQFEEVPIKRDEDLADTSNQADSGSSYYDKLEGNQADASCGKHLQIGDWVIVKYDTGYFPGEVTALKNNELMVNVMHPSGKNWKWQDTPDHILYFNSDELRIIDPPVVVGHRGQFAFTSL